MPAPSRRATMLACLAAVPLPAVSRAQSARHGDPIPAMAALAGAVAAEGQPDAGLAGLDKSLGATVGHKLFTVLVLNWDRGEFRRFYSSRPRAYPVGSGRPIPAKAGISRRSCVAAVRASRVTGTRSRRLRRSRPDSLARLRELRQRPGTLARQDARHAQPPARGELVHRRRPAGADRLRGDERACPSRDRPPLVSGATA